MDVLRPLANPKDYTRSPLGVVGLFMVLVYGLATISFTVENTLTSSQRWVLLGFVVLFPLAIFIGFLYLVAKLPRQLYGPSDFRTDDAFVAFTQGFTTIKGEITDPIPEPDDLESGQLALPPSPDSQLHELEFTSDTLDKVLLAVYFTQRGVFLGHVARPRPDGSYRVAIFLTGSPNVRDAQHAEFYFGSGWRSKIFQASPDNSGRLGVVVLANDGFLALCRVTFRDGSTLLLNHYCNLEGAIAGSSGSDS